MSKWDIRMELVGDVPVLNLSSGKYEDAAEGTVRIKYRLAGKKGRFETFVAVGGLGGATVEEVVQKYDEDLQSKRIAHEDNQRNLKRKDAQMKVSRSKKAPKLLMDRFKL